MGLDDVRSIVESIVQPGVEPGVEPGAAPVVVLPAATAGRWNAWFAGDEAAACAHRARLREASPATADAVSWIALERLGSPGASADALVDALVGRRAPAVADTALERLVAVVWHEALGVAPRGSDEDFFAAGGHSLLAADVAARLGDLLGLEVPLTMVLDRPTVSEQASWLAGAREAAATPAPRGAPVTTRVVATTAAVRGALAEGIAAMAARYGAGAVREVELGGRGAARREAWQRVVEELERPFAAGEAPWRAAVAGCARAGRCLVALAFDGRRLDPSSAALWLDDLIEACSAARERRAPVWPRRPRLDGALDAIAPVAVGWRAVRIAAPRARALFEVGRRQAAAPLATLAAAIAVLLARRTGRTDFVLEIPASLRVGPAQRTAIGALTTTAPIALSLADGPSFATVIERASRAICSAWAVAAGLAPPPAPRQVVVDASLELELPTARPAGWREAARATGSAAGLAFAARWTATGVLAVKVGHDGVEYSAGDAAAIAAGLDELLDELVADPARALPGVSAAAATIDEPAISPAFPLTHAQERLWFLENLAPGTTTNHLQRTYRLEGALDRDALARSLAALSRRHDALRTVFRVVDGPPRQFIARELALEHQVDPLEAADRAAAERAVGERAIADYDRPFDLAHGPLWRTRLCQVAANDHRLILTIHHLVVDALSFLVWYRELVEHYHAERAGTAPRVARIDASVAAVAAWERSPAGQQRIADDLAFWLGELAGATPLELPIDHRRPASDGLGRHEVHEPVPADRVAMVRALGRRHGATLNVTLIAAAAALLARHTQQDDLVVIVPASRRDDRGRRDVIGLLLNLLPLRLRLDGDPTFAEIIARTNRAMRRALAHAEAPFERIVGGLGLAREPGRQPLFDVILNMVPGPERLWWGDLRVTLDVVRGSSQPCDLVIGASTRAGGVLGLVVRCRDELFEASTAARWMARFRTLLLAAVASPHTRLSQLQVMPDDEYRTVVETWNRTERALPDATVHGLVEDRARERPDAIAVIQGEHTLRYRELDRRAEELAARLRARVAPGTHVGVLVPPSPALAVAALGVLKAGAVYVPLDAGQPAARLAVLAREVALVVVDPSTRDLLAIPHLDLDALDAPADPAPPVDAAPVSPDAIAYVVFTSGSTGGPKGVATTHRALVNQIAWFAHALPWRAGDVACLRSSPAFVDSLWELFGPLADGVPLVIATAAEMTDPRLLAAAAERHAVTRMVVVPSLLRTLLELGAGRRDFLPALTTWLATSEELKPALVKAFRAARPGSQLVNLYGASETADQVAAHVVAAADEDALRTPIGAPVANTQIYVLDRDGRPQPIGVPGEICVAGVGISERYLGDAPAADQARFTTSPFADARMYRTGDLGRWRHDGRLEYIGRLDHQLKIRGIRIDPGEVESALLAHPSVSAAAVTAHAGFDGEQRLAAYIVARDAPAPAELRRFLRARLPETLIPSSFLALAALPLGPTGKLDRAALPPPRSAATASRPPSGAVEHAVALAWEHLLGRPIGAEDDFFAAGGQSLIAAQLGAHLAERFAVELPLPVLFEHPTIAAQAAWLEAAALRSFHTGIPRIGGAAVPLSFAQERLWFSAALAPRAPSTKLRFALRIEGALDRDRLEAAVQMIAARHDALRMVFTGEGHAARQQVAASCPRDHLFEDLGALTESDERAAIARHHDAERDKPFDLAAGPPWRTRLLGLGDHLHVLIIVIHHYVADGISMQIWFDELHEHYAALAAGRAPAVAELTAGAADIAAWQRRMADSGYWEPSRRYWREALAGVVPIDLPLAAPRTGWSSGRGGAVRDHLTGGEADALAELARGERTTLFGVLLAAAGALLHRLTGRTDLVIGTIAAGRDRPELRAVMALLLNPLPLRLQLDGDPTLREIVARAGRASRAALAHSDVPFERIVADANPERRPFRQPLFDVVINHHPPAPPPQLGDLQVSHVRGAAAPVPPYELMFRTIARGRGLTVQLDYQRDRFADDTVEGWLAGYLAILRQLIAAPDRRLSAAP